MKDLTGLLGLRHRRRHCDLLHGDLHIRLVLKRHRIDHVPQLVVPAALFGGHWPDLRDRTTESERAVGDHACGRSQAARSEIAQHVRPTLRGIAMATLERQHHLRAVG